MLEGKTMGNSEAEWEKTRVKYEKLTVEIVGRDSEHVMRIKVPPRPNSKGVCIEGSGSGPTQGTSIATPVRQNGAAPGASRPERIGLDALHVNTCLGLLAPVQ